MREGEPELDNEFEQLMNLLRQHLVAQPNNDLASIEEGRNEPLVDEAFINELVDIAPAILANWAKYLQAGGELTLDQALLGEGNFSLRKAKASNKANQDYAFLHWLHLEQTAKREGKLPPKLADLAKLFDPINWRLVEQEYRAYRAGIAGLPPLPER